MRMNFGENIARSITGNVDKAILCVKKPDFYKPMKKVMEINKETGKETGKILGLKFDVSDSQATSLQSQLMNLSSKAKKEKAITNGYHILKVKYNPSKIQIDSRAGSFLKSGIGGEGTNTLTQINMPAQTFMNFEILFDEENHQDAFMFEKATNLSAGALVSDVAGVVKNIKNEEGYTVRPQVEALIGLLTQSETRQVVFYWSDMVFAGEVVSVDARYTMFNTMGNPIRAVVRLTIRQASQDPADNKYWIDAFDNLGKGGSGAQGKVSNLLNLR